MRNRERRNVFSGKGPHLCDFPRAVSQAQLHARAGLGFVARPQTHDVVGAGWHGLLLRGRWRAGRVVSRHGQGTLYSIV